MGVEGAKLIEETIDVFRQWKPIREEVIKFVSSNEIIKAAEITKGKGAKHVKLLSVQIKNLKTMQQKKH